MKNINFGFRLGVLFVTVISVASLKAGTRLATNTVNGIKWQILIDDVAKTARLGQFASNGSSANGYITSWAIAKDVVNGHLDIPSSFMVDGEEYATAEVGNRAFLHHEDITSVTIPETVTNYYQCAFYSCDILATLRFKSPVSPTIGMGRNYVDIKITHDAVFSASSKIKNVLVEPNLRLTGTKSYFKFANATSALVLLPYRGDNTTWAGINVQGTTPNVVYYSDIDPTDGKMVFSPTNATTLADALSTLPTLAQQIKTTFGLDTKVVVSSPIETATALPATFLESDIPLETTEWVAFSATTQEQLDDVLDACSADSKILIDPTGTTGRLVVPYGRNVSVLMSPNGEIKYDQDGIMIIVK